MGTFLSIIKMNKDYMIFSLGVSKIVISICDSTDCKVCNV